MTLAGEGKGALGGLGVDLSRSLDAVFLDHRQEVAEQGTLVVRQLLGAVGERGHGRPLAAAGANPRMTLPVGGGHGAIGPATGRRGRGACGALWLL